MTVVSSRNIYHHWDKHFTTAAYVTIGRLQEEVLFSYYLNRF